VIAYQWTTAVMAVLVAGIILFLVRRDHMLGPYAVWWIIAATGVAALGLFPRFFDGIAASLGVSYPPILFVVAALGLLLVKVLTMDLERSRQERKLRRLIQRVAMLEALLDSPTERRREAPRDPAP